MSSQFSQVKARTTIFTADASIKEIQEHLVRVCRIAMSTPMTTLNLSNVITSAPGKHFAITHPSTPKTFMGNDKEIPLISTTHSLRSVKSDS
jgi:hypothetical protein